MTRALTAEFLGTALLLVAIVGSGIVVSSHDDPSVQLFQHAVVVGVALGALILTFGHVSGAHFNPAVTVVDALFGGVSRRVATAYVAAQVAGGATGVVLTNVLFGEQAIAVSATVRSGAPLVASEALATFGLLIVIFGTVHAGRSSAVPAAVGAWITAAIFFTPSASFANPAVTLARGLTDTWTGIAPGGIVPFLAGQLAGAAAATVTIHWLFHPDAQEAADIVVPHEHEPS